MITCTFLLSNQSSQFLAPPRSIHTFNKSNRFIFDTFPTTYAR